MHGATACRLLVSSLCCLLQIVGACTTVAVLSCLTVGVAAVLLVASPCCWLCPAAIIGCCCCAGWIRRPCIIRSRKHGPAFGTKQWQRPVWLLRCCQSVTDTSGACIWLWVCWPRCPLALVAWSSLLMLPRLSAPGSEPRCNCWSRGACVSRRTERWDVFCALMVVCEQQCVWALPLSYVGQCQELERLELAATTYTYASCSFLSAVAATLHGVRGRHRRPTATVRACCRLLWSLETGTGEDYQQVCRAEKQSQADTS